MDVCVALARAHYAMLICCHPIVKFLKSIGLRVACWITLGASH